ncbi:deoxyribodipyrimidine photolyase [Sphingobacterium shayense]|uniref:deoxyribodipyrimidine photo-lyase n=1 Tax=Sphingobacterium shayense TaxID=626343 RepID=UPI0015541791|nr:deoxyribodipyrimidine photo-lyase [Sphingobacterium shayense]NQD69604.1 deoxyribodipyrimidine photolyase [Sphingobacterium shayense]
MTKKVILVWFRNDLRVQDNEILAEAVNKADIVIPVYFFDPRYFKTNRLGFQNTGVSRAQFLIETVQAFKHSLQELGADLLAFQGKPEDHIGTLCAKYDVTEVYHHREVAYRETKISELVEAALWEQKINLKHFIGHTLYHKEDLPIPIKDIPDNFAAFKKKVEKESFVRPAINPIEKIVTHPHIEQTQIPTLEDLGYEKNISTEITLIGGEDNALQTIAHTLSPEYNKIDDYNLVSPYIAIGAVSPAYYYHKIKEAYTPNKKKKYDRLILRLLWRDYFRFMLKKYPNIFFKNHDLSSDIDNSALVLHKWLQDEIEHPVIKELKSNMQQTGNLPYAHREILAAYMLQELKINHIAGAKVFEEFFLDYAPATVYGYWLHFTQKGPSLKDNLKTSWEELIKKNYTVNTSVK